MKLFLDSSVALAASMSGTGASREIFNLARSQNWSLHVSSWVLRETELNLKRKSPLATEIWNQLRSTLVLEDDELTFKWPVTFGAPKDKPVLFSALASADVLLTLDRRDFGGFLGRTVYGLWILTPGQFLRIAHEIGSVLPDPRH